MLSRFTVLFCVHWHFSNSQTVVSTKRLVDYWEFTIMVIWTYIYNIPTTYMYTLRKSRSIYVECCSCLIKRFVKAVIPISIETGLVNVRSFIVRVYVKCKYIIILYIYITQLRFFIRQLFEVLSRIIERKFP